MATNVLLPKLYAAPSEDHSLPSGRDRRKRHRAMMSLPVLVRGGIGSLEPFEDVGSTIDASRDGLLVKMTRGGFWQGQMIDVMFPYEGEASLVNPPQKARVVRSSLMLDHMHYAIAMEFHKQLLNDVDSTLAASYSPMHVRVLAVEPDERIGAAIRELLQQDGYQVVSVPSGKEALAFLRNETPDVLLAVAESGEISGLELCTIVKQSVRLQHIPVILLTHSARPSDYSSCHGVGAVVCMAVPCPPGRLHHAVRLVAPPPGMSSPYTGKVNVSPFIRLP
jgi:CheY-like chemotaxis protein